MNIRKEAELIRAIIVYCQRCQDEGDFYALNEMGIGPKEITAMRSLTTADALRLASTKSHFLNIKLNKEIYWRMIDYISRERDKEVLIDELILHEAPLPLMYALTGMGSKEYALKRRKCGFGAGLPGRPPTPPKDVSDSLWEVLRSTMRKTSILGPQEYLDIYRKLEMKVPIRVIWHQISLWERDGAMKSLQQPNRS